MTLTEGLADPRPVPVSKMVGLGLIIIALLIALMVVACRRLKQSERTSVQKPAPAAPAQPVPSCPEGQMYSEDQGRCATPE